jgi:DNA-binding NarL/FixJ family response regulator
MGEPEPERENRPVDSVPVIIVDDQAPFRRAAKAVLAATPGFSVVGEAGSGEEALELVETLGPGIVLMDINMPGIGGIEATRAIVSDPDLAGTRVVALTTYELDEYVFAALRAGASGYLTKDIRPDRLREAVHIVAGGEALLSPAATRAVIAKFAETPPARGVDEKRLAVLTAREREVVQLVALGLTNEEIGERLYMSPATARTHISRAVNKLNIRDRAHLVVVAFETGLARLT